MRIPRARITAPAIYFCFFALAYAYWLLFERGAHIDAHLDLLAILWFADLPVSILASFLTLGATFSATGHAVIPFAFIVWAVLGTVWWYFLGISIEAWVRRFSRKADQGARAPRYDHTIAVDPKRPSSTNRSTVAMPSESPCWLDKRKE